MSNLQTATTSTPSPEQIRSNSPLVLKGVTWQTYKYLMADVGCFPDKSALARFYFVDATRSHFIVMNTKLVDSLIQIIDYPCSTKDDLTAVWAYYEQHREECDKAIASCNKDKFLFRKLIS